MSQELEKWGSYNFPKPKAKPDEYKNLLREKMLDIKTEVNGEYPGLLDDDAKLTMNDDPVDNKFVHDRENKWATESHKTPLQWKIDNRKNPAIITEMVITYVLHKWLGSRFIVARASSYDDYKYGVDNVLIDKQTGAAVCGFDEVLGFKGDDGGEKKDEKIKDTILAGGSSVKYGATIIDDELKRRDLRSMPTFYLSLSRAELDTLLMDIGNSKIENERLILTKLVASLENQYEEAKKIATSRFLKINLEKFAGSLEIIKDIINQ